MVYCVYTQYTQSQYRIDRVKSNTDFAFVLSQPRDIPQQFQFITTYSIITVYLQASMCSRHVARILHCGGGAQKLRGWTFFLKKLTPFFSRRPQNLSSPSSGVDIFETHRTLLIERTVLGLLYWIKQAQCPKKQFFRKKIHSIDDWGHAPSLRPWCVFNKQTCSSAGWHNKCTICASALSTLYSTFNRWDLLTLSFDCFTYFSMLSR